jgi:hypothetical protein
VSHQCWAIKDFLREISVAITKYVILGDLLEVYLDTVLEA